MKLSLLDERPISWNKYYSGTHWSKRKSEADRVHFLMRCAIDPNATPFTGPVHITVTAYFDKQPLDCCNIPAKLYIDGLIGWLIEDDSPQFVRSVRTISRLDKQNPRVEILVLEANCGNE